MLQKAHLRVSRAGGGYRPEFVDDGRRELAARVASVFRDHVDERQGDLREALTALERESDDFKLVRGFASLLERDATFEARSVLPAGRVRRTVFERAEEIPVVSGEERDRVLDWAADRLGVERDEVENALYADREVNQILTSFDPRWSPDELIQQYNLSLAQTALFDATEVRVRSSDPKRLVSAVKRLGLMYEVRRTDEGRELVVTGPDALFRRSRRYGSSFARLLRSVASAAEWRLTATIDDRGRERTMTLTGEDVAVPGVEPVAEPGYDSTVEADFAARFRALDLDWDLVREPEPLATGTRVMIPDFAFDYRHADFRVYFEIMGFWTPEYLEKKLSQLADVEDVDMLVAVDESLAASEEIEARDHRAIPYSESVRVKDVVDVLREYESDLVDAAVDSLPDELVPDADVTTIEAVADDYGVSEDAIEGTRFPEHTRVGRTLVRPDVLERVDEDLSSGMSLSDAEAILDSVGIDETSAALSTLGYRVEWEGLGGGTLREKE